jgi:uncharacterized protein related to proFAR isomerase
MEIIPLIYMKKRKIFVDKTKSSLPQKEFFKKFETEKKIYILDLDGIEKNKPNLCTYQRLSNKYDLWVDFGPRNIGDVVDATMAGATDITLRKHLSPELNISDIRELSENKIYGNIDFDEELSNNNVDGFVNFYKKEEIESDFKYSDLFKRRIQKKKTYCYESNPKNWPYWKRYGVKDFIIDINRKKEVQ